MGVPFLSFNLWVSLWLFVYTIVCGLFDMTRYVRLASRFTDDVFAFLIVSIFLMDAIGDPFSDVGILRYFMPDHPSHEKFEDNPDYNFQETALLGVILGFGTTALIFFFRGIKQSTFLCNQGIRTAFHDFAVTLAVVVATLAKEILFPKIDMEGLNTPDKFEPTFKCCDSTCSSFWPDDCPEIVDPTGTRSWFVDWFDLNGKTWVPFFATVPALLAFMLCYLDCVSDPGSSCSI